MVDKKLLVQDEGVTPTQELEFSLLDFSGHPIFYEAQQITVDALVRAVFVVVYSAVNPSHMQVLQHWLEQWKLKANMRIPIQD